MERRLSSRDAVFDPGPDVAEDDHAAFTPAAYLPSPDADPADLMEDVDWHEDAASRMSDALEDLDERSRHILENRWLAEKKQTLHELAAHYGVSAERIRQIESNAIKKLRVAMEA
jgi:RNA polymerase sigma-32 factor